MPLSELELKFERSRAEEALALSRALPLLLPPEGKYVLKLEQETLHVFETSAGVSKFSCPEAATRLSNEGDVVLILKPASSCSEVVLHADRAEDDPKALRAEDLPAKQLIEEYEALSAKQGLSLAEKKRSIELIAEIRKCYGR